MSKIRFLLVIAAVFVLLALPLTSAVAQGSYYYCSATRTSGGSGTYYDPWACSTQAQMTTVTNTICNLGGGTLYQIHTGSYVVFTVRWTGNACTVSTGQQVPGYPPNTGVDLPAPLVYGGVAFAGVALLAGGLLLRRKRIA